MAKEIIVNMPIVLKVGMLFKTVDGDLVKIIGIEPEFEYPIAARLFSENDNIWTFLTYTADGKYYNDGCKSKNDLLAYIP